jgi:hypothetical protein
MAFIQIGRDQIRITKMSILEVFIRLMHKTGNEKAAVAGLSLQDVQMFPKSDGEAMAVVTMRHAYNMVTVLERTDLVKILLVIQNS